MFQGWVERWPQQWEDDGTFSEVTPDIVDSFAVLSQTLIKPPFHLDVLALGPAFFFPLNDPAGSTTAVDVTGKYTPAPVVNSQYGTGSLAFGESVQSTTPAGTFLGTGGPVAKFDNSDSVGGQFNPGTYIALDQAGVLSQPPAGGWTRMIAFNTSALQSWNYTFWSAHSPTYNFAAGHPPALGLGMYGTATGNPGQLTLYCGSGDANFFNITSPGAFNDGNWHLLFVTLNSAGTAFGYSIDGAAFTTTTAATSQQPQQIVSDTIGQSVWYGSNENYGGLQGSMAHAAQWNYQLSNAQIANLYDSWRTCWAGDSTDQRYSRILGWIGYQGKTNIQAGQTRSMGPATDLLPTTGAGGNLVTNGVDALTALNNVVITENGNHFVDSNGVLTFKSRADRTRPFVPVVTFGEQPLNGEIPYEDLKLDFDTTQVGNDVQITQWSTQQVFYSEGSGGNPVNSTSQNRFGIRTLQRTVNSSNQQECIDASNYYLYRYGTADTRVAKIRVHVSALYNAKFNVTGNAADKGYAWPLLLALEMGSPVAVMRRPPGWTTPIQLSCFVEKIDWDDSPSVSYVELQLSPADKYQTALWTAMHTTLNVQANAGSNSVTLNALADASVNAFSSYAYQGLQLEFEPGTSRAETVTVQTVGANAVGYSTVVITLAANLTYTHPANSVVCEPLPAGATSPTFWDQQALFLTTASNAPSY